MVPDRGAVMPAVSVCGSPIVIVGIMRFGSETSRISVSSELVLASLSVSVTPISWPEFHSVPASIAMSVVLNPMPPVMRLSYVD